MDWKSFIRPFSLQVVLMSALTLTRLGLADADVPKVSITFKPAAEYMQIGDSLPLFIIIENQSQTSLSDIQIMHPPGDFFISEPLSGETQPGLLAAGAATIVGFRIRPIVEAKPGKYTILFNFSYRWQDDQGKARDPVQVVKDVTLEVRTPLQAGISAPTVNVSAKAAGDTLREGELLQLYVFIENKSPVPLRGVTVKSLGPPSLEIVEIPAQPPMDSTIHPFETRTELWTAELKTEAEGLKYGKHTLFFDVHYQWDYGGTRFTSRALASMEISSSFFGSEAVSQVFGIPLNLIVFVLPGFCFLFVYQALNVKLLKEGVLFTPTSKDGLFYSVLCSVAFIFFYKKIFQKDLYGFFTLSDLFVVNVIAAVTGSVVFLFPFAKERWKEYRKRLKEEAEQALRFTETDDPLTMLKKALSRQPDPDQYQEGLVTEGNCEWKGIILSRPGEDVVLGAQLSITSTKADIVAELEKIKSHSADEVPQFLKALSKSVDAREITIEPTKESAKLIQYKDKDKENQWQNYGANIKILDSKLQVAPKAVIYLIEFQ